MVRLLCIATIATLALSVIGGSSRSHPNAHRRSSLARRNNNVNTLDVPVARSKQGIRRRSKSSTCKSQSASASASAIPTATSSSDDSTSTSSGEDSTATGSGTNSTGTGDVTGGASGKTGSTADVSTPAALLPADPGSDSWTVAATTVSPVQKLTLTDNTFIETKAISDLSHEVVTEDGQPAIHAHFDAGSYDLKPSPPGGFSFYSPGPKGPDGQPLLDMSKATEVSFAYSVKFSAGYDWVQGGKLPGLYGGINADVAATCSGGNHDEGCFSTRFMFRTDGQGELYLYIPPALNRANLCGDTGTSQCRAASSNGKTYGASIGTGLWSFQAGAWTSVRQVIHLNTPGQTDGWAKVYVNGATDPILTVSDISYRSTASSVFVGMQMQTFHGGHDPSWAPDQAQDSYFRDFSIVITETS